MPSVRREPPLPKITGPARLVVTVVDGDRNSRVRRAAVRLWGRSARTDATGVAEIVVPRRQGLNVTVGARGFGTRTVWENFLASRKVTLRVYRPELQWPMYGATATRAQTQTHIRLRPPFRVVWTRGLGTLIEFPAVVDDGVAYIGNASATIRAISMRTGKVLWRHDTSHGRMASSPAVVGARLVYHTMDGQVIVLDRANGTRLWSTSSARRSSRRRSCGTASTTSARGTDGCTRSTCARVGSAGRARSARRSPRAPRSRRPALHRRLRRPPAGRSRRVAARRAGPLGERADLRHAGRARRSRLRAVVDRRLADGVLDHRSLPLARQHGLLRLLLARRIRRTRVLRLVQRRLLRRLRRERAYRVDGRHRRADLGRGRRRRRRRVRGQLRAQNRRRRHAQRPRFAAVRARTLRSGLRKREVLTFSRLLSSLCSGAQAFRDRETTATHHKRHLRHERK